MEQKKFSRFECRVTNPAETRCDNGGYGSKPKCRFLIGADDSCHGSWPPLAHLAQAEGGETRTDERELVPGDSTGGNGILSRTPFTLPPLHQKNGCFRRYHPYPQGTRPDRRRERRAARDAPSRVADPENRSRNRVSEKKKPYPLPIGPGDAPGASPRAVSTPPIGRYRLSLTFAAPFSSLRSRSAARPPVSSAARPSRCVRIPRQPPRSRYRNRLSIAPPRAPGLTRRPPSPLLRQAAAVNTVTEAKVKVAINGFGRIGASPVPRQPTNPRKLLGTLAAARAR